jgi:hypothetical protein
VYTNTCNGGLPGRPSTTDRQALSRWLCSFRLQKRSRDRQLFHPPNPIISLSEAKHVLRILSYWLKCTPCSAGKIMVSRASSLTMRGEQSCSVLELSWCIYTFPLSFPFASSFPEMLEVLFSVLVWFQNASNSRSCCFRSNSACFLWS